MVSAASWTKRLLTFVTGLLECMGFAGVVFGWASLVYVLKVEKYFANFCDTTGQITDNSSISTGFIVCHVQDEHFSLIFTICSFMNSFTSLPSGIIFDRFGTMSTRLIGIFVYTLGAFLIAISSPDSAWLLFPALLLLAIGGIIFIITNLQVGNLFGRHRSTVITMYTGAYDSSSAVFLLVKVLHEKGMSLLSMFLFLSFCSIFHLIRTFFLMPRHHIPYPLPENYNYGLSLKSGNNEVAPYNQGGVPNRSTEAGSAADPSQKSLMGQAAPAGTPEASFGSCVFSWLFASHVLWLSVLQFRHYLYIGTLNPMLTHLAGGDQEKISLYTNAFAFTQLCGILCSPWNGIIMDRHKRGMNKDESTEASNKLADLRSSIVSLAITSGQCVLFSFFAAIPILAVQYATFILEVVNRAFLYGGNAAFLALAFPGIHFGKLFGVAMALAAIVSLLQLPCILLVTHMLRGDPLYLNIALVFVVFITFIHPTTVFMECRRKERANQQNLPTTSGTR